MAGELEPGEHLVLSSKGELNALHGAVVRGRLDAIQNAVKAGDILRKWKATIRHGEYLDHVERHFDGSERSARDYAKASEIFENMTPKDRKAFLAEGTLASLMPPKSKKTAEPADLKPQPPVAPNLPEGDSGPSNGNAPEGGAAASVTAASTEEPAPASDYDDAELDEALTPEPEKPVSGFDRFMELWNSLDDMAQAAIRAWFFDENRA